MPEPIPIDRLAEALALEDHELVALVGGGGKTTALFALGRQLGPRTILTTTTRMGRDRTGGHVPLVDPDDDRLRSALAAGGTVLVWGAEHEHRALGVEPHVCDAWFALADHVIVEADGSRRRPFKAPAPHEPVVPDATTVLVACVGSTAFDAVIADVCHRPDRVAEIAACRPEDRLTPERLATVLASPEGSRKGCPAGARFVVMLNRVDAAHTDFVEDVHRRLGDHASLIAVARFAPEDSPENR